MTPVGADEYYADATGPVAPRPRNSVLDLSRIEATGFVAPGWRESLAAYLRA